MRTSQPFSTQYSTNQRDLEVGFDWNALALPARPISTIDILINKRGSLAHTATDEESAWGRTVLWIASCDNDMDHLKALMKETQDYLTRYPEQEGTAYSLHSAAKLERYILAGETYSLYRWEIIMPESGGIQLGWLIRAKSAVTPIIYVTAFLDKYALYPRTVSGETDSGQWRTYVEIGLSRSTACTSDT